MKKPWERSAMQAVIDLVLSKALPKSRPARWTTLAGLSLALGAQACADLTQLDDEELEELQQGLGEEDGGASTGGGTGGGITGGGIVGGGIVGGTFGGLGGLVGGTTGGIFGGTDGGFLGGGVDAGPDLDAGPGDAGPPRDGGILGGLDGGFPGGPFGPQPFANWKFDDCGASTTLIDSSPNRANALRSTQVSCAQGLSAGAVLFDQKKDTVIAAAHPAFSVAERVAVAAWVNPTNIKQGNIVSKSLNGTKVFELVLQNGNLIFRININNGRRVRQVVSKAPITANRWTHVAGLYDGTFVRLFEDGAQIGQVAATGLIEDAPGAIEIGNNQAQDWVHGRIDEVWLSKDPVTANDIATLSCIVGSPSISATPFSSGPQDPGASFTYDVTITNNDVGACTPRSAFFFNFNSPPPGFSITSTDGFKDLPAGSTGHFPITVTSSFDAEPGSTLIPLSFLVNGRVFEPTPILNTQVEYILREPTGCFVRTNRELLVRDVSVVDDPVRTSFDGAPDDPRVGVWTFARLMRDMAPRPEVAPAMVAELFQTWLSDQTINTFTVPARPAMQQTVLDAWPRTEGGELDLERAPLRLLSIVNRIDSRNLAQGHAGEGRFVFGVLGPFGEPLEFTFILEYRLPAQTTADVVDWANRWHALSTLPFPSEEYNTALQAITDRFAGRNAEPGRPNGSALAQLRTNDFALVFHWELREFELSATTGRLAPVTVKLTPDTSFIQGSPLIADYINANEASLLVEQHVVPDLFQGQHIAGGNSFNDLLAWTAPGVRNNEARHKFSLNTCNGCHSSEETGTSFLHIFPRSPGEMSQISPFMAGTTVFDVVTGEPRQLNDLARRNRDMTQIVCPTPDGEPGFAPAAAGRGTSTSSAREAFLSKGISRTH